MKKKNAAAVIGVAIAGTFLTVSMQGSAQASTPPQATGALSAQATTEDAPKAPQARAAGRAAAAAGRAAARATVHARAAAGSLANQAGQVANNFSLFAPPAKVSGDGASAAATVFDR
ncbi:MULTISPECIES: hypothetical protein [Streptomyces]|jgi:hypothetical protein|uniref:Secreted protein n=2 Tax=Streptomyces TaxID=1883 RepID=A0AA89THP4_STRCU|nr:MULTISPECIES: hypothetical protein [Streptomyces]MBB5812634.1 hypothetical protein [Streptomyces collinus]WMX65772.1 hypothetical protein RFN52_21450 [Streptomyces collinus]WND19355.1 hypothetical protein RI060_19230 [Streptomyces janthinus]GGS61463.1 hypothetical protein GCM10010270_35600 [Streptomyces janthinus]